MRVEGSKLHSLTCVTDDLVFNLVSKNRALKLQTASQNTQMAFSFGGVGAPELASPLVA
jgi:hypothetical protein